VWEPSRPAILRLLRYTAFDTATAPGGARMKLSHVLRCDAALFLGIVEDGLRKKSLSGRGAERLGADPTAASRVARSSRPEGMGVSVVPAFPAEER
jgi:hypothetical protein